MADTFNMSDVMISYSRRDKLFVRQLEQSLRDEGLEVWIDWEDIAPTANWWAEIQAGIEAAHTFVFVITPAAVRSEVCKREVEHAVVHHKRLVPILHEDLSEEDRSYLHPALSMHNWIYFRETDHFRQAFLMLRAALETDLEHKKMHTRLLVRAREWMEQEHGASLLLRGDDLREAENWLGRSLAQKPHPTEAQINYIRASRRAAGRFAQRLAAGVIFGLVLLSVGMFFAVAQSQQANAQTQRALDEAHLRATQEWLANDSLAAAATAQMLAADGAAAAATAQKQVLDAQTQEWIALQNSGNSQTQAYVAQQSALTATVLQGQAEALANEAEQQQQNAEAAQQQAQQQAANAQQQAALAQAAQQTSQRQADIGATDASIQVIQAQATAAAAETLGAESQLQADIAGTQAQATVIQAQAQVNGVIATIQPTVDAAQVALSTANAIQTQTRETSTAIMEEFAYHAARATDISVQITSILQDLQSIYVSATETAEAVKQALCVVQDTCSP